VKRVGGIFGQILSHDNLELAFYKACRGKRTHPDCRQYAANLDAELAKLHDGLADGTFRIGRYHRFRVHDPKEREICAAPFRERVLHHAIMNVCEAHFERWLEPTTFACRKGMGQLKAVEAAGRNARTCEWYMKCDFRKYFDSIPHAGLIRMLERRFKDRDVLAWFGRIIATYEKTPQTGIPIGNLTSQHLANLYLAPLDRLHRGLAVRYVRYMDDFVYWSDSKETLLDLRDRLGHFVKDDLGLTLKQPPHIQRTSRGMDFLGYRVMRGGLKPSRASLRRYRRKVTFYERLVEAGWWSESDFERHVTPMTSFLAHARSEGWLRGFHERKYRKILASDETRRGATASNVAAAGTTTPRTAAPRTATTTPRRTATTTTASAFVVACPQQRSPQAGHPPSGTGLRASEANTNRLHAPGSAIRSRERCVQALFDFETDLPIAPREGDAS